MEILTLTPEEFLYYQSEEYALVREREEREWYENYEAEEERLIKRINSLLSEQTFDAYDTLLAMFQEDHELHEIYANRERIALVYILLSIYQRERYEGISSVILERGTQLEQFDKLFTDIKFLLWRITFFDAEHSTKSGYGDTAEWENALLEYVEANRLSPIALCFFVNAICVEPSKMLLYLADKYMEQKKLYNSMMILKCYDGFYPRNEDVRYMLSELERIL